MKIFKNEKIERCIKDTYNQLLSMWDVSIEEKDVLTTFGTTHVIVCGEVSNPPIVLFHGVGDNSALMWIYNAKELAKHFRVYSIDTIGGPGKSCPNDHYNKNFNDIQWIDEVLDALDIEQIYLAGVSNGSYLIQYYCLERSKRVLKMVCMAGSVPVDDSISSMKKMMKVFMPEALLPSKKNVVKLIKKLTGKNSQVFIDNSVIMEHYGYLLKGFNNMAMKYHILKKFTDDEINIIRGKTLFLIGESDPFAKLGGKENLEKYKMNYRCFAEVGHGINHEISEEINKVLIEYFVQ